MSDRNSENFGGNRGYGAISGSEVGREGPRGGNASGSSVEWGPAIAVDGKRPGFVADGVQPIMLHNRMGWHEYSAQRVDPEHVGWSFADDSVNVDQIRLPADHPHYRQTEEAPIDWSGELEAVHEDGRVVPARYDGVPKRFNGHKVSYDDGEGEWSWCVFEDGRTMIDQSWRIRNVIPQPTPQADTKPDVTVRAPCMTISEVREMVAKGEGAVIATMLERGYALPEPVDEDLIEARKLAHEFVGDRAGWQGILEGKHDSSPAITQLITAIKRGRELALAGETGK